MLKISVKKGDYNWLRSVEVKEKVTKGPLFWYLCVHFQHIMMHIKNLRATINNLRQGPKNNITISV